MLTDDLKVQLIEKANILTRGVILPVEQYELPCLSHTAIFNHVTAMELSLQLTS